MPKLPLVPLNDVSMTMALDAWAMTEQQANEHIILTTDDANTENIVIDDLAGAILWSAPIPSKKYEQQRAWAHAQGVLFEMRRRRVVNAIIAAAIVGAS